MTAPDPQDAPPTPGAPAPLPGVDAPLTGIEAGMPARAEPAPSEPLNIGHPTEDQLRLANVKAGGRQPAIDPRPDLDAD